MIIIIIKQRNKEYIYIYIIVGKKIRTHRQTHSKMKAFFGGKSYKTFKPLKKSTKTHQQKLRDYTAATLGSGNMRGAVVVPEGEDKNEWLAANTLDFFDHVSLLYGIVAESAAAKYTKQSEGFPAGYEYRWADGVKVKNPIKCSSPEYVKYVMDWADEKINDTSLFPIEDGAAHPKGFFKELQSIYKRLFRIYAIMYAVHTDLIKELGAEAHLNTCFKHFMFFILEFKLVADKEMKPIKSICDRYIEQFNS